MLKMLLGVRLNHNKVWPTMSTLLSLLQPAMDHTAHKMSDDYMAHGYCFSWEKPLVALHVGADILTGLSYYSIPIAMLYFAYNRRDIPYRSIFIMFALFIMSCGTTHLFAAYTVFDPLYYQEGFVKGITALISVTTALVFIPKLPEFLALPNFKESLGKAQESEFFFRESQRAAHIGSYKLNFVTGIWDGSEVLDELFGIDATYEKTITNWGALVHPDDRDMMMNYLQNTIIRDKQQFDKEYRIIRASDGEGRWLRGLGRVTCNDAGEVTHMIGTILDVTERKTSEAWHKAIIDTAMDGFWVVGPNGNILEVNKTYCDMSGFTTDDLVSKRISDLEGSEDTKTVIEHIQRIKSKGGDKFESQHRKKDGTLFDVEVSVQYKPIEKEDRFVVFIADISDRKRSEEDHLKMLERISQGQKLEALGGLVAGISHDINNVLAAILSMSSARATLTQDPKDQNAYHIIEKACERGRSVLSSLVKFAKPEMHDITQIDVNSLLLEVKHLLDSTTSKRIQIIEEYTPDLWILGDLGNLNHAITNLCINAFHAMPEKGTLTLRTKAIDKDWIEIDVEDTGTGMSPEVQAKALEPFFTTKATGEGSGLGLSMAYGVMKAHRGAIEIHSTPNVGTTIKLVFPRIAAPIEVGEEEPLEEVVPQIPMKIHVLLIDDDELIRESSSSLLEMFGYKVTTAESGYTALEALTKDSFDLVILDMNMPEMDGIETLKRIRSIPLDTPVLIASGQPNLHELECFKKEYTDVISKPFSLREVKQKLNEMLRNSHE